MLNKRTILFFTDTFNKAVAENIKAEFKGNNEVASVIVTKEELRSRAYNAFLSFILPSGSSRRLHAFNQRIKWKSLGMNKKRKRGLVVLPAHKKIQKRMLNAINRYNPSVIVVTEQSVLRDVLFAVDKYAKEVKVAVVPDEYILDKRLIDGAVNFYFVDNLDMRNSLTDNGIPDDKVVICGLPVGRKIFDERDRKSAVTKFAVNDSNPTILISASKAGDIRFKKVLEELKNANLNMNFIVACGKNRRILNHARTLGYSAYNDGIDMNSALNACDAVITRPTTMLMAEALAKGKEVFALLPNGKMETATLNYLGIDLVTKISSLPQLIEKLRSFNDIFAEINADSDEEGFEDFPEQKGESSAKMIAENLITLTTVTREE